MASCGKGGRPHAEELSTKAVLNLGRGQGSVDKKKWKDEPSSLSLSLFWVCVLGSVRGWRVSIEGRALALHNVNPVWFMALYKDPRAPIEVNPTRRDSQTKQKQKQRTTTKTKKGVLQSQPACPWVLYKQSRPITNNNCIVRDWRDKTADRKPALHGVWSPASLIIPRVVPWEWSLNTEPGVNPVHDCVWLQNKTKIKTLKMHS